MKNTLRELKNEMARLANPNQAQLLQGFFKTGKGQYGEGDVFLGIKVPVQRNLAKKYRDLDWKGIQRLLDSKIHEHRLTALFILTGRYNRADDKEKKEIFDFYLRNTKNINNWDLVDSSAPIIVGNYLLGRKKNILRKFAKSANLWERRIAILSTLAFICNGRCKDTFAVAEMLLKDEHDLIHKAAGWMLREVGKRISEEEEKKFLRKHYKNMPRTMLRYAIERFSKKDKKLFMGK